MFALNAIDEEIKNVVYLKTTFEKKCSFLIRTGWLTHDFVRKNKATKSVPLFIQITSHWIKAYNFVCMYHFCTYNTSRELRKEHFNFKHFVFRLFIIYIIYLCKFQLRSLLLLAIEQLNLSIWQ